MIDSGILRFARILVVVLLGVLSFLPEVVIAEELVLDETPARGEEWGYRPADGVVSEVNPPSFSWRPQKGLTWELECALDTKFEKIEYRAENLQFNVHCPPRVFNPGTYTWRYRGKDQKERFTNCSQPRTFTIAKNAVAMPLPPRDELIARISKTHPRLFIRPENLPHLRRRKGSGLA